MEKVKVLIVDDERDIRELLADFLESEGYDCIPVQDAFTALDIYKNQPGIDLVMSDIRMPGKNGLELLSEIKAHDEDAMVIMISAVKDIESAITSMSRGAYDYVAKPFKLNEVAMIAQKALEKRRLLLENKEYQKNLEKMVAERTQQLQTALKELNATYTYTLQAMVTALDTRDTETQGHSLRVVHYTLLLSKLMNIKDESVLKDFEYGALLHDIGKIGIPDSILRKPGKLTPEEWQVMKSHPQLGYNILPRTPFLQNAAQMVLHHHESFNGQGYPDGLKGEEITLGARIFAVADTIDAMTSDRPYRAALTFEAAAAELQLFSGRQFDPKVIEAFNKLDINTWKKEKLLVDNQIKLQPMQLGL